MLQRRLKCKKTVFCYFLIALISITCISIQIPSAFGADKPVKVLVLPFQINSENDLSYLRGQIASMLAQQLGKEGAEAVTLKESEIEEALRVTAGTPDQIRQLALNYNADYVLWGSFTLIGNNFSLDVKLMATEVGAVPTRFFSEGRNLENLIGVSSGISDQIALKVFHRQMVSEVHIQGNQRIEADAILRVIKTHGGEVYKPEMISNDIRAIYEMGYFDDVRVDTQIGPKGLVVTFQVKEKPTIRYIVIKGNSYIDEDKIRENLTITTGAILNTFKIRSNVDQIEQLYKEKNYHQAKVDYKIKPLENNQADLEIDIEEGPKLYVTNIRFEGNKAFSAKTLKSEMKVSEKGFFYWLTSSGDLDRAVLDQDVARLNAYYSNKGYINARIGEPQIDLQDKGIQITLKIEEGDRYKVGNVSITGDLIVSKQELMKKLAITQETYFSREKVRNDVLALTDVYADQGYAYADISPRIDQKPEQLLVDITYAIQKREQVYFEKIIITGNTRTRDKVIRRELHVHEQGLFSGSKLKRSIRNLYRLDYFEDIKVDTLKGSTPDKMVLKLDVTEKPTGTFTFGAGYSSEENVFFQGSIFQRNLFGRGQTLEFSGTIGSRTSLFSLSFTEPYLFDTHLSSTVKAYNQDRDYDTYNRKSDGGGVMFGYPVADYTTFYTGYHFDRSDIKPIEGYEFLLPNDIKELQGVNITSSADVQLIYDSRDRLFNTTEGSKNSLSFEYAGLGGDIGFNKVIGQTMWYIPIYKSLIGFVNAKAGWVGKNDPDKILPDYQKFYLGGITSMRGFGYHGIHLMELNDDGYQVEVGGDRMVQLNFELIFPLVAQAGVNGVFFYDRGNVYDGNVDLTEMRHSAGAGIRWLSPIAPIRVEYGYILDRQEDEPRGRWEFTMGGSF